MNYTSKSYINQTSLNGDLFVVHDSHSLGSFNFKKMEYHKILTLEPLKGTFLIDGVLIELTEIFKDIPDFEGVYQVSTFGRTKTFKKEEKILIATKSGGGYYRVDLQKEGKRKMVKVCMLVSIAFLGHTPNGTNKIVVDHKDNIRTHDYLSNLQLITNRENCSKDKTNKSSKYTGVHWSKQNKKWKATIRINQKKIYLGYFDVELEASEAYQTKLREIS